MNQRSLYYGLPLFIIIICFIFWRGLYAQPDSSSSRAGKPFPSINLPTLLDSGKRFTKQDLTGRVSMVNFWASWCEACQQEHSVLVWIKNNYSIPIYGINFQDDPSEARAMLMRLGNPFNITVSDQMGSTALTMGVDVLPQTYLVDAHGRIRYRHVGTLNKSLFQYTILPLIQKIEQE